MNTNRLSRMQFYALSRSICGSDAESIYNDLVILFKTDAPQKSTLNIWLVNFKETKATLDSIEIEPLHDENNETLPSSKRSSLKSIELNEKPSLISSANEIKQLTKKLNAHIEREKEMRSYRENMTATVATYKSQIFNLLQENSILKTKMEELSQKETEDKRKLREEICNLHLTNMDLNQELTAAKYGRIFESNNTLDTTSLGFEINQTAIKELESQLASLQEENERLRAENCSKSLTNSLEKIISQKEKFIQDCSQEIDSLKQKIEILTKNNVLLTEINNNLIEKLVQIESDFNEMEVNITHILNSFDQEKQLVYSQNIDESKRLLESFLTELNANNLHIEGLENDVNHLKTQILDYSKIESNLNAEKTELLGLLDGLTKLNENLKEANLMQKSEQNKLNEQLEACKKAMQQNDMQTKELVLKICDFGELLKMSESHAIESKKCLEVVSARFDELENEYENSKKDYEIQISELLKHNDKYTNTLLNDSADNPNESTRIIGNVRNKVQLDAVDDESMIEVKILENFNFS